MTASKEVKRLAERFRGRVHSAFEVAEEGDRIEHAPGAFWLVGALQKIAR